MVAKIYYTIFFIIIISSLFFIFYKKRNIKSYIFSDINNSDSNNLSFQNKIKEIDELKIYKKVTEEETEKIWNNGRSDRLMIQRSFEKKYPYDDTSKDVMISINKELYTCFIEKLYSDNNQEYLNKYFKNLSNNFPKNQLDSTFPINQDKDKFFYDKTYFDSMFKSMFIQKLFENGIPQLLNTYPINN